MTRDYLIWCLPQQPALLDAVRHSFSWERFVGLVTSVGDRLRRLINVHGWSALFLGDPEPDAPVSNKPGDWQSGWSMIKTTKGTAKGKTKSAKGAKTKTTREASTVSPAAPGTTTTTTPTLPEWSLQYASSSAFASETQRSQHDQEWTVHVPHPIHHRLLLQFLNRLLPVWNALGHEHVPRNYGRLVQILHDFPHHAAVVASFKAQDAENKRRHVKVNEDLAFLGEAQKAMSEVFYYRHRPTFLALVNSSRNKARGSAPYAIPPPGAPAPGSHELSVCV